MNFVLDSSALIAFLRAEAGGADVREILSRHPCYAHAVNLCEVYYDFLRAADHPTALAALDDLTAAGLIEVDQLTRPLWLAAGRLKARGRISLADCIGLALAAEHQATFLTADRHELATVAASGSHAIQFIR